MSTENWSDMKHFDPSIALEKFATKVTSHIEDCTVTIQKRQKLTKLKPWISDYLLKKINLRNSLSWKLKKPTNNYSYLQRQKCEQKITKLSLFIKNQVLREKENFYSNKLKYISRVKDKWNFINGIIGNSKGSVKEISSIKNLNGDIITNSFDIGNIFNTYFSNVANDLLNLNKVPHIFPIHDKDFFLYNKTVINSIFFILCPLMKYLQQLCH